MPRKRPSAKARPSNKTRRHLLPKRSAVPIEDRWDLSALYPTDAAWEADFDKWQRQVENYGTFKGSLGTSAQCLADCMRFDADFWRLGERLGSYASLQAAVDQSDSSYQRMKGRYQHVAVKAGEASAFIRPEILAIPATTLEAFLGEEVLAPWVLAIKRVVRYRPHTLTPHEEEILALSGQMSDAPGQIFRQLTDTDLKWPVLKDDKGRLVELEHSSFARFLRSPVRAVRKRAFDVYYEQYEKHKHTLAASYNAAVQRDVFYARVRHYPGVREASLFEDNVPVAVYDALLEAVHRHLPANHRYLALRHAALKLPAAGRAAGIHMYDTYVPLVAGIRRRFTWEQAVDAVTAALAPLGDQYTRTLRKGLTTARWADRYPNAAKRSGAFSAGGYDGPPYILMNYQPDVLDHVFTLAHEAGHSMHTWHAARHQPFQYYGYAIFVAEVASTFNEQLLLKHMLDRAASDKEKAYLLCHAIDEIRGTIIRQTMFAEFEKITHELVEKGEPLTVDLLRLEYRRLLERYFGVAEGKPGTTSEPGAVSRFVIDPALELEGLRIPHFYGAFYVYKYATGLSAAIALARRVLNGGRRELNDYLDFLKGGCSKWPLDLLRDAGVDMEKPAPVETALERFGELVDQLEGLM